MCAALPTGRIVISNRVTNPLQPTMQPFSLVLFQPAYSTGQPPDTPQERVDTCTGGTLVILNMFRFVGGVDCSEGARMCCALFDQTAPYGELSAYSLDTEACWLKSDSYSVPLLLQDRGF